MKKLLMNIRYQRLFCDIIKCYMMSVIFVSLFYTGLQLKQVELPKEWLRPNVFFGITGEMFLIYLTCYICYRIVQSIYFNKYRYLKTDTRAYTISNICLATAIEDIADKEPDYYEKPLQDFVSKLCYCPHQESLHYDPSYDVIK